MLLYHYSLDQLSIKIQQSLGVASDCQLLVHQVDDNQSPINLSSLEQHQFQQYIISIRPDQVSVIVSVCVCVCACVRVCMCVCVCVCACAYDV